MKLFVLDRNKWNHLTVSKKITSGLFKNAPYKMFRIHIFNICIKGFDIK